MNDLLFFKEGLHGGDGMYLNHLGTLLGEIREPPRQQVPILEGPLVNADAQDVEKRWSQNLQLLVEGICF